MSNCCNTTEPASPKRHTCPVNGKPYKQVSTVTVMHHVTQPWRWKHNEQAYYFCDDPDCDVVYFGLDNSILKAESLRTKVGIKDSADTSLVCYCFGVTRQQSINAPETKAFVIEQTRNQACACSTRNPSGLCCLKDFP